MAETSASSVATATPYLRRARIRNYAPLRDARVDFKPGLNIIIGSNGVGKTRFLNLTSQLTDPFGMPRMGIGCELVLGYDQDINLFFQQTPLIKDNASNLRINRLAPLEIKIVYGTKKSSNKDVFEALFKVGLNSHLYEVVFAKHGTPLQRLLLVDLPATFSFGETSGMEVEPDVDLTEITNRPLLIHSILNTLGFAFNRRQTYRRVNKLPWTFSEVEARAEVERVIATYLEFLNPYLAGYSPINQVRLSTTYQLLLRTE